MAEPETRRLLVAELMNEANIEKLLRDSFANYVIQTCLEYADQDQRVQVKHQTDRKLWIFNVLLNTHFYVSNDLFQLVESIRPLLPSIRSTPYGKRIHSKIQREQHSQGRTSHRGPRHHQSMSSLRLGGGGGNASSGNGYGHGAAGGLSQAGGSPLAFGLPFDMMGSNNTLYPY